MPWIADDVTEVAVERILEAAEELFAENGPHGISMEAVARAAGCSRATLYRYFENRQALQFAFVHREARRIVELVVNAIEGIDDPHQRAVEAVVLVLAEVRSEPTLMAWAGPSDSARLSDLLHESPLIETFTARFVGERDEFPDLDLARWVLRVIVSFLAVPAADHDEERRMIDRFLAPLMTVR
jgi:AcrR family transcriptional regulator